MFSNSRPSETSFNVTRLSDARQGFDMCCGLTPIILAILPQLLPACSSPPDLTLERFLPMWTNTGGPAAGGGSLQGPFTERATAVSSSQRSENVNPSLTTRDEGSKLKTESIKNVCVLSAGVAL